MNTSKLRSKVPIVGQGTAQETETASANQSGSLGLKILLGVALFGVWMIRRRLRSRSRAATAAASEDDDTPETEADTNRPAKGTKRLGRRLRMMIVSTLVFALARMAIRRLGSTD